MQRVGERPRHLQLLRVHVAAPERHAEHHDVHGEEDRQAELDQRPPSVAVAVGLGRQNRRGEPAAAAAIDRSDSGRSRRCHAFAAVMAPAGRSSRRPVRELVVGHGGLRISVCRSGNR